MSASVNCTCDGNSAASIDLLQREYCGLFLALRRRCGSRELAEDLVQQAIVEALGKLAAREIADPARLAGYVYRVAMNLMRNHRRKFVNRPQARVGEAVLDMLSNGQDDPLQQLEAGIAGEVRQLVEELRTPRDRAIVTRFYLEEEDKAAICADLRLSSLHFDKVIFRARKRLRALLEAKGWVVADAR